MSTIPKPQPTTRKFSEPTIGERFRALNTASSRDAATLATQGKQASLWGLLFSPFLTFLYAYLRRGEWRRGRAGLITAIFTAYEVFVRHAKLWELHHSKPAPPPSQP
ncbi:MAG TPA: hypothetical protein VGX03_13080 [Candidatus Binatia bacterium]|jgi:hypothetical protein|nr:hypothetical protein [Candidatus Binatia bacterium]